MTWKHDNALSPNRYLPESLGPGVAFIDYDNDGWPDIFLVNSGPCSFYKPPANTRHALYRNNRDGTFTDVTQTAGLAGGTSFGMGAAAADFNNDGYDDVVVGESYYDVGTGTDNGRINWLHYAWEDPATPDATGSGVRFAGADGALRGWDHLR